MFFFSTYGKSLNLVLIGKQLCFYYVVSIIITQSKSFTF